MRYGGRCTSRALVRGGTATLPPRRKRTWGDITRPYPSHLIRPHCCCDPISWILRTGGDNKKNNPQGRARSVGGDTIVTGTRDRVISLLDEHVSARPTASA